MNQEVYRLCCSQPIMICPSQNNWNSVSLNIMLSGTCLVAWIILPTRHLFWLSAQLGTIDGRRLYMMGRIGKK
jgi:hypothetical protein